MSFSTQECRARNNFAWKLDQDKQKTCKWSGNSWGKGQEDSTILEIINHTFIGGQACTIDLCIGVLYGCHLLVRYWRISDEYLCFCYCIFGGLKRYLHRRYPRRCKPHQWKMLAHLPPGLPGKPSINWNSVSCMQCFFVNCWLLHGYIRITTAFMAQKPAEPKDLPRQWSSNVRSSTVTDIQTVLVEDIWQTLGLQTALQLTSWNHCKVIQGLPGLEHLLMESCTW